MRTRLLRPEFWADSTMADLAEGTRLTYMGLWCLADDDGYLHWSTRDIAAELYRYESPRRRESRVERQLGELVAAERVEVLPCGVHAVIASIPRHRIKGGNHSSSIHQVHTSTCSVPLRRDKSPSCSVSGSSSLSVSGSSSLSVSGAASSRAPARDEHDGSIDPKGARNRQPYEEERAEELKRIIRDPNASPSKKELAKVQLDAWGVTYVAT